MRFVRFNNDGATSNGILEGEEVVEIEGSIFNDNRPTGRRYQLADVALTVPVEPRTFYAASLNYPGHAEKMAAMLGRAPNSG